MPSSKKLSYLLRHSDVPNEQGWISVEDLVNMFGYTEQSLRQIVASDEKHRYELSEDMSKIRARYGHSNHVKIHYEPDFPPAVLYHGTSRTNIGAIMQEGLKSMDRQHVYLSSTVEAAIKVGRRHGEPVVIEVDAQRMSEDGLLFYPLADNGIWMTGYVDPKYIKLQECHA